MNENKTYTFTLIQFDIVNRNGRLYTRKAFMNAVNDYQKKINNKTAFGTIGYPDGVTIPLTEVSHSVENIDVKDTYATVSIRVLNTTKGKQILEMMEKDEIVVRPGGYGNLSKCGIIENYTMTTTAIIPKYQDAFNQ